MMTEQTGGQIKSSWGNGGGKEHKMFSSFFFLSCRKTGGDLMEKNVLQCGKRM